MKKISFKILLINTILVYGSINMYAQTISAGTAHTAVICGNDSAVISWGDNSNGQLGINDTTQQTTPVRTHGPGNIGFLDNIRQIVIRENFSVALMYDSTVWAWGFNGDGELGINNTIDSWIPVQVHGPGNAGHLSGIIQISVGYAHCIALRSDGTVWAWGDNTNGELGDSTTTNRLAPVQVHGLLNIGFLTGVTRIAAGQQFNLALIPGGNVLSWGLDTNGELGDNNTTDKHIPVQVHGPGNVGFLTGVTSIAAGGQHALALRLDSTVWSWGFNINGELGDNTTNLDSLPKEVHGPGNVGFLTGITFIKAGDYFSGAIKGDSTVWVWGFNFYGQLGVNDTTERNTPVQVHGTNNSGFISQVTEIALGDEHMILKKSDGSLRACGWNGNGQIGDGTTTDRWAPVIVIDPCSISLGVPPVNEAGTILIYPNPANQNLYIKNEMGSASPINAEIYNTLGQLVSRYQFTDDLISVPVDNLTTGTYLIKFYNDKTVVVRKFSKL